ncbi:hypothetical protein B9T11_02910 [Wohlfahrtiimonas chitiniclastica]|uniref:lysophospholipid acyltransferase family protein n=1 Tax=Wohlfahrtiimonas chitiniclastica TaxID=400946 RepID=UPI000B992579|nr:lysophospholipid acyltransferase family protein [Wohlfahrtiimonas chitiniclastica]OYQ70750.1 hypothetical protein B9T13_05650 [Wohlfahrtiimonas chitiniclastica]OYQ81967.1 hypothetical protein B9T11_02910 [Wohlfahrtiimonas chitiniclastica]OYQ83956.1 hypothetical protein B9T14_06945 [Wohlfahrtiimonas chitiniclastica]OYQ84795.1 hypothetical protein B9T15_06975 [Wohlfahrtiimonas chitiniclastica]
MSDSIPLRRRIRAKVITALLRFFARFSLKSLYRLSDLIAFGLYHIPNQTRKIAARNLQLAFPELLDAERQTLLKETLRHNSATLFEMSFMWLNPYEKILQSVTNITVPPEFTEDQAHYPQMIFITPHFGSWELSGLYASSLYPLATLYRPSRLYIDPIIIEGRGKNGAVLVSTTTQGIRDMMKAMKNGRSVGILPDQDPGHGEGIFAPFFNLPTNTMGLVSRLANRFDIPAYIVASKRDLATGTFTIELIKIDDQLRDPDTLTSVTALNHAIETEIRKAPEQYLWTYKRFKTAPEGEPDRYQHLD